MEHKFKVGDLVECVNATGSMRLRRGRTYKVYGVDERFLFLSEEDAKARTGWIHGRFKLVTSAPEPETEQDPHDIPQHEPGAKLDKGKPRAALLLDFGNALTAVAEVATYGAEKYSDGGWLHVPNGEQRYADAGMRHRLADNTEPTDPESGLSHLAHAAWNILAELELRIRAQK